MISVNDIASAIVEREGGYVNDPDDPGGATNYGVTIGALRRLGMDINGDGKIDRDDVRRLSKAEAITIFRRHYFEGPGIAALPDILQPSVFDMYVNAGRNAVLILQKLFQDMGLDVSVDGAIGPNTVASANRAYKLAPGHLADAYGIARRNYYYSLADRRPKSRKFACRRDGGKGGWIKRAEEFIAPRFHLSIAEHAERVAVWES